MATKYTLSYGQVKTKETSTVPVVKLSYGQLYIYFLYTASGAILETAVSLAFTASVALTNVIKLSAVPSLSFITIFAITNYIRLGASVNMAFTTTNQLTNYIRFGASPVINFTISSSGLTNKIQMSCVPIFAFSTVSDLSVSVIAALACNPLLSFTTGVNLTNRIKLNSRAQINLTVTSSLISKIRLASTPQIAFTGVVNLTNKIQMSSLASIVFSATGDLSVAARIQMAVAATISFNAVSNLSTLLVLVPTKTYDLEIVELTIPTNLIYTGLQTEQVEVEKETEVIRI